MKAVYPVILKKGKKYIIADIPDFNIGTQGKDFADAIEMARDAIGIMGIDMEDDGQQIPASTDIKSVKITENDIISLVDIDFDEYRRKNEMRAVKKNCTIPSWLNYEAEKAQINFSQTLQNALMEQLGVSKK